LAGLALDLPGYLRQQCSQLDIADGRHLRKGSHLSHGAPQQWVRQQLELLRSTHQEIEQKGVLLQELSHPS
jgi:hypothetical protein